MINKSYIIYKLVYTKKKEVLHFMIKIYGHKEIKFEKKKIVTGAFQSLKCFKRASSAFFQIPKFLNNSRMTYFMVFFHPLKKY